MASEEVEPTLSKEEMSVVQQVNDPPSHVPVIEDDGDLASVTKNVVDDNAPVVHHEEVTQLQSIDEKVENNNVDVCKLEFTDNEIKALVELKKLIQLALDNHEFSSNLKDLKDGESSPPATAEQQEEQEVKTEKKLPEEVSIWGVPLLKDSRTDTILRKFLRARDFKPKDAFTMLKNTLKWRKEFQIDTLLLEEDLGNKDLRNKVTFMHGVSKEGHPVCYNVYGEFRDRELYLNTFSDEVKRHKFLKWRVQFMEKSVRNLDFNPNGGINTIVQVNDLKNSPGPGKWELRQATKLALQLFQGNYPEFVAKQVFINVPWWYVAVNKMISPFLTQRTKSKFVMAGPSKSAETLFNYIAPEQVPIQYGGLSKTAELSLKDGVTQITVKPSSKETIEFPVNEACQIRWEVRVVGWEVSYGAEFVPNNKDNYIIFIQKEKKIGPNEETVVTKTFKASEPGKVVLTIHNSSSKKKLLLYRLCPIVALSHEIIS